MGSPTFSLLSCSAKLSIFSTHFSIPCWRAVFRDNVTSFDTLSIRLISLIRMKRVIRMTEMQKAVNAVNTFVLLFCTVVLIFVLCTSIDCTSEISFWPYMSIGQKLCSCANLWAVYSNFESYYAVLPCI